jgi:hypothetical protein
VLLIAALLAGCKVSRTFECAMDTDCGGGGACETTHFCSFVDGSCGSGRRYDEYAGGGFAGDCVGATAGDGGIDAPIQAPGCPVGYFKYGTLASGYRVVSAQANWLAAETDCENDGTGTHLIFVDNSTENDATERDMIGEATFWSGANDRITEGTYKTTANQPQTFLPWKSGEPDGAAEDCINVDETDFLDDDCNQSHAFICECDGMAPVAGSY